MKFIVISLLILTSCSTLPQLYQSAESIANNDCITVKVDKDAFGKDTDVNVSVEVKNKEKS